jgi:hypothetical protein
MPTSLYQAGVVPQRQGAHNPMTPNLGLLRVNLARCPG